MGVCPRGARVRRTGGLSETPDSSRKQTQPPAAPPPLIRGHSWAPAGDLGLIALDGAAGGLLHAPIEPPQ
jgi:hypothetical protein